VTDIRDCWSMKNSKRLTPSSSEACAMISKRARGSFAPSRGWSNQVVGPEPAVVQAERPVSTTNNNRARIESFFIIDHRFTLMTTDLHRFAQMKSAKSNNQRKSVVNLWSIIHHIWVVCSWLLLPQLLLQSPKCLGFFGNCFSLHLNRALVFRHDEACVCPAK